MAETPSPQPLPPEAQVPSTGATASDWLRLFRPRQWTKNLLLFAALLFAQKLFHVPSLALAGLGFVTFCVASSAVYVLNDLIDAERDRQHPEKCRRPIAAGRISRGAAATAAALLAGGALLMAFNIRPAFAAWTLAYLGLNFFYSTAGKHVAILDVMLIASGFVIRAIAGAVAIHVPYSEWFILCTLFLAVFLAASKRKAELLSLDAEAANHRAVLGTYTRASLDAFTSTSMAGAVLSYALYVVAENPGEEVHLLAFTVPFVMFGVFRYQLLAETSHLADKPEEVLLQDRPMQVCIAGFAIVAALALYVG